MFDNYAMANDVLVFTDTVEVWPSTLGWWVEIVDNGYRHSTVISREDAVRIANLILRYEDGRP